MTFSVRVAPIPHLDEGRTMKEGKIYQGRKLKTEREEGKKKGRKKGPNRRKEG